VEVTGPGVRVIWAPERALDLAEIAAVTNVGRHGMSLPGDLQVAIERTAYFKPQRAVYSSGVHAVIVEVDAETGKVAVLRSVLGHDCGTILNPLLVEGQMLGGYAHGIGNALYEEAVYSAEGQPQAASYLDYALPTALEVDRPELFHVESPSPLNPLGVKGAGEGGLIPVPAAIANAVEDALRPFGARITQLPVTPSRVVAALRGQDGS
jgi:carbon-monoxide dehydrogenase large subunit